METEASGDDDAAVKKGDAKKEKPKEIEKPKEEEKINYKKIKTRARRGFYKHENLFSDQLGVYVEDELQMSSLLSGVRACTDLAFFCIF